MSKTVDNEKIKLKAAFFNNIGVGSALGGAYIPAANLYQGNPSALKELLGGTPSFNGFIALIGMIFFLGAGYLLHRQGLKILDDLKD